MTSALNAFELQGDEAARVYDVIFKTVKGGKTDISKLSQGFGAVAGQVAAAGIKFDEFLASVGALTTAGLPASQAYTQLRAVVAGLTRETRESSYVFRKLGVKSFKGLVAASGGMIPALSKVKALIGDNDAVMLKLLGSTEALNALLSLTGSQGDAFNAILDDMRNGSDAVTEGFQKQAKTFNSSMMFLRSAIERLAISFGKVLAPYIAMAGEYIADLVDRFDNLSPSTKNMVAVFLALAAALGPALIAIGLLGTAVAAVGLPVILVAGAIATLGGFLAYLYAEGHPIGRMFTEIGIAFDRVGAALSRAFGGDARSSFVSFADVIRILGNAFYFLLTPVRMVVETLTTAIELVSAISRMDFGAAASALSGYAGRQASIAMDAGRVLANRGNVGGVSDYRVGSSLAEELAAFRSGGNRLDLSGNINVTASGNAKVTQSDIKLNGGNNVATAQ